MSTTTLDVTKSLPLDGGHPAVSPLVGVRLREAPVAMDRGRVRSLLAATGFFTAEEIAIAIELIDERLARGSASDYRFVFADRPRKLVGYACFGPIPLTAASYDLYWIAVAPKHQGQGLGRRLLSAVEHRVAELGGGRIYVDTSTREQYASTRAFYRRCGYHEAARLDDFYRPGDGKAVYCKVLGREPKVPSCPA